MSTDNNDNGISRDAYHALIEAEHGENSFCRNREMCDRLNNGDGVKNIAPIHPVDIISIYPQGGIVGKLNADLVKANPNYKLDFNQLAMDNNTPSTPTTGGPGFKPKA
ncbi:MAG: hypothetical protein DYH13_09440 [Alphaproteobacteria bacterium PRO2]|nr:hypothetical protein [Alphaproteobacteria bacterium PRO2]